jgi:galactose oxidase
LVLLAQVTPSLAAGYGQWGQTINFPLVPVAGVVEPASGQLIVWSAYATNTYQAGKSGVTQTAVYNPADGSVKLFPVDYTGHDMFCPGISMDFNGNTLVTGGDTSSAASLFRQGNWNWAKMSPMNLGRGYQSSTTLSDGRIFTIGGSWSGGVGGKDGEIFDGSRWTMMRGCRVAPMLTNDRGGVFRSDSHAWLFAWKDASVLQAGPSRAMNWYTMRGSGTQTGAGTRGSDNHAMCGTATMYDAVAGKILTAGGSPDYEGSPATANANILTIGSVGGTVQVEQVASMSGARIFSSSIVLPDGTVLIIGGQTYGKVFYDDGAIMTPELWDPNTKRFTKLATGPTPRNYHSIALLMLDGTVFSGGGGLCGDCGNRNHFDGQFFSPPYLFGSDGKTRASRPQISNAPSTIRVGSTITVTLASGTNRGASFSMVRMGSSTHTVNTDQRRVPLRASATGANTYSMTVPSDPGIALPGYWYLFAMFNSVPSVAKIVKVTL